MRHITPRAIFVEKKCSTQEAPVSITFGRHVSNRLKIIYTESSRRDLSIDICMGRIGGGGGVGGCPSFVAPPSKNLLDHSYKILNISSESSALSPVEWHPIWANWVKGGACGHVQNSEAHALGCRPRSESSQWSSNSPQTYRMVPA
jgi:hypothetical protein